jgi:hypothetical protein
MRASTLLCGLSLAFATTAHAQMPWQATQQPGTVEYFITHTAERYAMDERCARSGGWPIVCQNAQKADHYIQLAESRQRVNTGRMGVGSVDSPAYFDANPFARQMTLQACAHPTTAIRPDAVECQAARISSAR